VIPFLLGVLGLSALEVVLSSERATNRVGGIAEGLAAITQRIISPDLGLIPNLHDEDHRSARPSTSTGSQPAPPLPTRLPTRPAPPGKGLVTKSGGLSDPDAGRPPVLAPPVGRKEAS
jgi:hypothetical protein